MNKKNFFIFGFMILIVINFCYSSSIITDQHALTFELGGELNDRYFFGQRFIANKNIRIIGGGLYTSSDYPTVCQIYDHDYNWLENGTISGSFCYFDNTTEINSGEEFIVGYTVEDEDVFWVPYTNTVSYPYMYTNVELIAQEQRLDGSWSNRTSDMNFWQNVTTEEIISDTNPTLSINTNLTDTINFDSDYFFISYNGTISDYDGLFDCFLANFTDVLNYSFNVNLSNNNEFILDLTDIEVGNFTNLHIDCSGNTDYNVSSIETLIGTENSGDINSIITLNDNDAYNVSEIVGQPAFDIRVNGTNFVNINEILLNYRYEGNPSHIIEFQIYNFLTSKWEYIDTLPDTGLSYSLKEYNISNSTPYISSGEAKARFYHNSSGNINHDFYIDYLHAEISNISDRTIDYILAFDLIPPQLVIESDFTNNSIVYNNEEQLIQISITDENNYYYNFTILEINDDEIMYNSEGSTLGNYVYLFNYTVIGNSFGLGVYSAEMIAYDSHTTQELISEIVVIDDYNFNYRGISISSDKKLKFDKKKDKYIFIVDTKATLCYETPYFWEQITPKHYVDLYSGVWVDDLNYNFEVIGINKLCFYNEKDKEYITDSIGDLNINSKTWYFNITSPPSQTDVYLSQLVDINTRIYGVLEMLGYISLMIFGVLLPFIPKEQIYKELAIISSIFIFLYLWGVWSTSVLRWLMLFLSLMYVLGFEEPKEFV